MKKKHINKNIKINIIILIIILVVALFILTNSNKENKEKLVYSPDVTIRYAYGIGVYTAQNMNSQEPYIDILKIELTNEQLKTLKEIIKDYSFIINKAKNNTGIAGIYELTIGNQIILIDQEEALYTKDKKNYYKIDMETKLFDFVSDIVYEKVESKQEKITSNEIFLSNDQIGSVTFNNQSKIKEIINTIRYVKLKSLGNASLDQENYYIDFNNGITITTYMNSTTALYKNENTNEEYYILLYNDPSEYLRSFIEEKLELDSIEEYNNNNQ